MFRSPVKFWHILLLAAVVWGTEHATRTLWEPDEARYAYVSREMRHDGHWLVPHRHGVYYAHKPPLIFWMNNAAATLFTGGKITRITTRIPSLIGVILALWATAGLASHLFGPSTSWRSIGILATAYLFWKTGGMGQIDALLCGLQMLALYLLFVPNRHRKRTNLRAAMAYLAMGLAILAKGPVGFLVPYGAYIAAAAASRNWKLLKRWHLAWGPLLAVLPVGAWLAAVALSNPPDGYLAELLYKQNIGRVDGSIGGHKRSVFYFLWHFPLEFLPWTFCLPAVIAGLRGQPQRRKEVLLLLGWIGFVLLFFSIPVMKRNLYILLAYPAAAILFGVAWCHVPTLDLARRKRFAWIALAPLLAIGAVAAIILIALPCLRTAWATNLIGPDRMDELNSLGLPIWSIAIPATTLLAGLAVLIRTTVTSPCTARWLGAFIGLFLAVQVSVAAAVYPGLNAIKSPMTLTDTASSLPDDGYVILYKMHGEIQALYAGRAGREAWNAKEALRLMNQQPNGMIHLRERDWKDLVDLVPTEAGVVHRYRMGSKEMMWYDYHLNTNPLTGSPSEP